MKRWLLNCLSFTVLMSFVSPSVLAHEITVARQIELTNNLTLSQLIEADLVANQSQIQALSESLSFYDKKFVYQHYQKQPLNTFLINLLPIGGYASYQQGDLFGGISQTVLDGAGWSLIASSFLPDMRTNGGYSAGILLSYGIISLLTSRVVGGVTPWVHAHYYNEVLARSLSYTQSEPERMSVLGFPIYFQTSFAF